MSIYSTITKNQKSGEDHPAFKGSDIEEYYSDRDDVENGYGNKTPPSASRSH